MVTDEHFKKGMDALLQGLELIDETFIKVADNIDTLRERLDEVRDAIEDLKQED